MNHCINGNIQTPAGLGAARSGFAHTAIAPPKGRIDRADFGCRLAAAEEETFATHGNAISMSAEGRAENAA